MKNEECKIKNGKRKKKYSSYRYLHFTFCIFNFALAEA